MVIETGTIRKLGAVSYSPSIVTVALSRIVCEILRLIGRKSQNFYTPRVFSTLERGTVTLLVFRKDV